MENRFTGVAPRLQGTTQFGKVADEVGNLFRNSFGGQNVAARFNRAPATLAGNHSVSSTTAPRVNSAGGGWRADARPFDVSGWYTSSTEAKKAAADAGFRSAVATIGKAGPTGTMADEHNAELSAASAQFGVPVNFLKAILIRESSGNWTRDGSRLVSLRNDVILPFVGIFNNTWRSWGCPGDARSALGNKQAQIDCMARGARLLYDKAKAASPSYDWRNVFSMYFSGKWEPSGWQDENGLSDTYYVDAAMKDMQRFDQMAGSGSYQTPFGAMGAAAGAAAGGAGRAAISSIWGGKGNPDLSYGFNAPNNLGLYAYGSSYGMNGSGHTGVDIPMPIGSAAYTPVSGTVVCSCKGNGPGADGSGCAAFSDVMGRGCGRIEVKLDNGHTLIFGHMSETRVQVGQRVSAGQQIGTVGGMNGPHIHLEYRIPDRSTPSGWRIVDPMQYLNGQITASPMDSAGMEAEMPYNPNVPWQGWKGRQIGQTRAAQNAYRPVSSWRL